MPKRNTRVIIYQFALPGGVTKEFSVELELPALEIISAAQGDPPSWTDLRFKQCPNCSLALHRSSRCPVAMNLAPVIVAFNDLASYENVETTVLTEAREFRKRCPLQTGLSSLIGLIMATSGCPVLDRLRPMAYTHLPFATSKETTLRAISTYLLAQCVRQRQGRTAIWEFDQLVQTYDDVRMVNKAFLERIRSMCTRDAGVNAIVILDTFASLASFALNEQWWKDIEPLFAPRAALGNECQRHQPPPPRGSMPGPGQRHRHR